MMDKCLDLVHSMVLAAVQSHDLDGDVLTSSGFAGVVSERFLMRKVLTPEWAAEVLSKLPYVQLIKLHCWRYLPSLIGCNRDNVDGELVLFAGAGGTDAADEECSGQ
jgi:hypothetical protein